MTRPTLIQRIISALQLGFRLHGILFPFVVVQRFLQLQGRRWFGQQTFEFDGRTHCYCIHHYSLDNERTVEVALAKDWLREQKGEILELGNVLSNYMSISHDVVDKYEVAPGVLNEDIVDYSPQKKYAGIVSVSTLEHVGWDEQPRDPEKIGRAIQHLKTLLAPGGSMFVTLPIGYNPKVDQMVRSGTNSFSKSGYLLRESKNNRWREAKLPEVCDSKYASPFPCANAIFVGIYVNNSQK